MEKANLISYYERPYFIFNGTPKTIEDDEILDLDSISLGSNEDTWLMSDSKSKQDETSSCFKELDFDEIEKKLENESLVDKTSEFSRLSLNNWDFQEDTISSSFLSIEKATNRRKVDPVSGNKSLMSWADQNQNIALKLEEELKDLNLSIENNSSILKKPLNRNNTDKSHILFSIENKLFNDTNGEHKLDVTHEIKSVGDFVKPSKEILPEKNHFELNGSQKRKSLVNEQPRAVFHSTPMEKPVPMLVKRRINQCEDEKDSRRLSVEEFKIIGSEMNTNGTCRKDSMSFEQLNSTYDVEDNMSTSSTESRISSGSSNLSCKTAMYTRTIPKRSSTGLNGTITRPASACSSIRSPSQVRHSRERSFPESKMKQPAKRVPSLSRLPAPSLNMDEEFISVVEIKSKGTNPNNGDVKSGNSCAASHIPRPSTRIPIFRSSVSCTRTSSSRK